MRIYVLSATYENMTTTLPIPARDNFSAKVAASRKINASYVSDKRYAKGEITLKNQEGKAIWTISKE